MTCPRCLSTDVDLSTLTCRSCRLSYDNPKTYEPHTREHTMVSKRWERWRGVDRNEVERRRVDNLLGLRGTRLPG